MKCCIRLTLYIIIGLLYIGLTSQNQISLFSNKQIKKLFDNYKLNSSCILLSNIPDSCYWSLGLNGKMYLYTDTSSIIQYIYMGRVNTCRAGGCSIKNNQSSTYENFDYIILFNRNKSVEVVKIIEYNATHGQEITAPSWLKQFKNYNGEDTLEVGKNIDAISGATISTNSITKNIQQVIKLFQCIK